MVPWYAVSALWHFGIFPFLWRLKVRDVVVKMVTWTYLRFYLPKVGFLPARHNLIMHIRCKMFKAVATRKIWVFLAVFSVIFLIFQVRPDRVYACVSYILILIQLTIVYTVLALFSCWVLYLILGFYTFLTILHSLWLLYVVFG